jgi:hypothetical protein
MTGLLQQRKYLPAITKEKTDTNKKTKYKE